ncbi:Aldehyde/histidinol dehydrogenase [Fusarium oxysporum Fo47]|nr:Aldehyde/histidinol dehydrogenase [Fusarium oxysporum Fo47]QKD57872.1 Aldehyde/histidinol dehydrogenase [Fusarium oxysporum Fo47]
MTKTDNSRQGGPVPHVIAGKQVHLDESFDVIRPDTGIVVHKASNAGVPQALSAVRSGTIAFGSWSLTTPGERRNIFLKAANVIDHRWTELKQYMMTETGCDEGWAEFNLSAAKGHVLDCAGRIVAVEGGIPILDDASVGALVVKEPYGVVLAMAPWNAPYALGFRAVIWAIAAGNTVVLKGSELSPRCYWAVSSVLEEAGLPPGVLNFITCSPSNAPNVAKAMIESPEIKKINFTGSTAIGRIIAQMAGTSLKPILLELGGKAPAIVLQDADLEVTAKECVLGAFIHAGQVCMSTERILVHKDIKHSLEEKLREWVERIFPSSGAAPVLISSNAVTKNKRLATDAVGKGAKLVCGQVDGDTNTTRLRPIIISGIKPDMEIYEKESFGPTVSLIEFETEAEALQIANNTEYGLSSAIFTRDLRKALRLAKRIETGAVHINRMTVQDEAVLPHGGAKASGFGRFNAGLGEWLRTKNITYDL